MHKDVKSWDQAEDLLKQALEAQPRPIAGALISIAEWRNGNGATSAGAVRFVDQEPSSLRHHTYPALELTEQYIPEPEAIPKLLELIRSHHGDELNAKWSRLARDTDDGQPRWELTIPGKGSHAPTNSPSTAFGQPPWSDTAAAVNEWLGIRSWDAKAWRIELPDTRAIMHDVSFSGAGMLQVTIDRSLAPDELELQVTWGGKTRGEIIDRALWASATSVTLTAPDDVDHATLYLVHRDEDVLHELSSYRGLRERRQAEGPGLIEQCKRDLAQGEGVEIEYKPWISPDHPKRNEILKTIVAFANTRGGRLYIGALNSGELEGRPALYSAFPPGKGNASPQERAKLWARQLIQDKLEPHPPFEIELPEVYGEPLLCIMVGRGPETPYSVGNAQVYVRRGSNTRRVDPEAIRQMCSSGAPELLAPLII